MIEYIATEYTHVEYTVVQDTAGKYTLVGPM
jgi:hypothetical protein